MTSTGVGKPSPHARPFQSEVVHGPAYEIPDDMVPTPDDPALLIYRLEDPRTGQRRFHCVNSRHAHTIEFEHAIPVRRFLRYQGQRNTPGLYYCRTTGGMIAYESHLEQKWLTVFDFARDVSAIASQVFTIRALENGTTWTHTPDLFLRADNGDVTVVDVKNPRYLDDLKVLQQARRTEQLCTAIGFDYRLVGEPDPARWRSISWLSGYKRPLALPGDLIDGVLAAAAEPTTIGALVSSSTHPALAHTVVMSLLWQGQLSFDLGQPLSDDSRVVAGTASPHLITLIPEPRSLT